MPGRAAVRVCGTGQTSARLLGTAYVLCLWQPWLLPLMPPGQVGVLGSCGGRRKCLPTKYASRMTSVAEMRMALSAAHFQLQYLEGFLRLKAGREKVLRGRGRGGGEYTVLDVKGYPGDVVQKSGEVPPGLKRKCLWMERGGKVSGSAS